MLIAYHQCSYLFYLAIGRLKTTIEPAALLADNDATIG